MGKWLGLHEFGFGKTIIWILAVGNLFILSAASIANEDRKAFRELIKLSLEELLAVNIITSVSKKPENLQDAPATAMIITARQIRERGYEFFDEALRDLPGFDFVHVHGTYPLIWAQRGIYGDENKRMLVFIDGIVENNILEGSVLGGSQYSLHNVERIEVIWGPASALYGANAFTGIVNIITRKGSDIDGFEYYKGFGSYDTRFDKFAFGKRFNDLDIAVSGSLYNTDGPVFEERHPDYNVSYVDDAYSLTGRLQYKKTDIGFSRFSRPMGHGLFANSPSVQMYGLPPYGYQNSEGTDSGTAPVDVNGETSALWESAVQTVFLKQEAAINERFSMKAALYYKESGIKEGSKSTFFNKKNNAYELFYYAHESDMTGAELQLNYNLDEDRDITAGIQYDRSNVERGYRGRIETDPPPGTDDIYKIYRLSDERVYDIYRNKAAYAQYRHRTRLFNSASFIFGIRYDDNNVYGDVTNPRLGTVIKPTDKWTVKALYGSAYKAPSSFDLYTETDKRVSNPDLLPEKVRSYEMNIGYKFTRNFLFEAGLFHNRFKDIITSNVDVGDIDNDGVIETQNRNKGGVVIKGAELKADFGLTKDMLGFFNYTYQTTRQSDGEGNSFPVANVARHKANIGINYLFRGLLNINLTGNWVGDRTTATTNPRSEIDAYFLTNLTLSSTNLLHKHFNFSLSVHNLFHEHYADPGIRVADGTYYPTQNEQPGRSVFLKIGASF
ncbi:MAG: TonB-dependent receptor [Gammaproteobacteria bacterium]|nr:TonB-dependent receptor [Gammaproteobacteria bacterium]